MKERWGKKLQHFLLGWVANFASLCFEQGQGFVESAEPPFPSHPPPPPPAPTNLIMNAIILCQICNIPNHMFYFFLNTGGSVSRSPTMPLEPEFPELHSSPCEVDYPDLSTATDLPNGGRLVTYYSLNPSRPSLAFPFVSGKIHSGIGLGRGKRYGGVGGRFDHNSPTPSPSGTLPCPSPTPERILPETNGDAGYSRSNSPNPSGLSLFILDF